MKSKLAKKSQTPDNSRSKKSTVLRAVLINVVVAALLFSLWQALVVIMGSLSKTAPSASLLISMALGASVNVYIAYRLAYWSLKAGVFKPKKHALLTVLMIYVQHATAWLISYGLLLKNGQSKSLREEFVKAHVGVPQIIEFALGLLIYYACLSILIYIFAYMRASRKLEGFDTMESNAPHISKKLRPCMFAYGVLTTLIGLMTILGNVQDVREGNFVYSINIVAWSVYLLLFWVAYEGKIVGQQNFWRAFVPLVIALDVAGVAVMSHYKIVEILVSVILSLPLYITAYWYGYTFLPAARQREINRIQPEHLFQ